MRKEKGNKSLTYVCKEKPTFTPFEADIVRYMHITSCEVIVGVWQPYWEFCPICCAKYTDEGNMVHRERKEVIC